MSAKGSLRKPGKSDVSRPGRAGDYAFKRRFYRDEAVAADYDFHRFGSPERARRNARKWRTILRALDRASGVKTILDLPCGTGRFTGALCERGFEVVGSDISLEMMQVARPKTVDLPGCAGYLQADAEALPLRAGAVDCVMSIRFLFHVEPEARVRILREMARVSRRWLILDYRHRYSTRYWLWRLKRALGLTDLALRRVSRRQVVDELHAAGLELIEILPVVRIWSDKWIVVAERAKAG